MSLNNSYHFQETLIHWDMIEEATHNHYMVVASRPYKGNKDKGLDAGITVTLQVIEDDFDYGVDKTGKPIENNVFQTFDATVIGYDGEVAKGDLVSLHDFDQENSFVVKFDMILRFHGMQVLKRGAVAPKPAKQAGNAPA